MRSIRSGFVGIALAVLIIGGAQGAWAQATSTNSVSGLVTDPSQAAIPGTEVRLVDTSTNAVLTTRTNDVGRYIFINLPPSTYRATFTKDGFNTYRVQDLKVEIGTAMSVNAVLDIGTTATTVEVTASSAVVLQTSNAAVGTSLTGDTLQNLPNMGRDVSTLAVLQPGTTLGGYTAGAYNDQNTYQLDGGNATDDMSGSTTAYQTNFTGLGGTQTSGSPSGVIPTPVESIEEFRVSGFNQTADFNNSIGGQVQMATKRGSNQFHGSGYGFYFATNVGAANSWANNHTPSSGLPYTPLPSNHRDRFGFSLGGPLTPQVGGSKTYFFFNYEGLRFPNVGNIERLVPTALMRVGVIQLPNASGAYQAYNLNPVPVTVNGTTYQPAQCGSGLCDPRALGLNPIVSKVWNYLPLPNDFSYGGTGSDGVNTAGYLGTVRAPLTSNTYIGRVDHDFGANWRFMSSYRYMRLINLTTNQLDMGGLVSSGSVGQFNAVAPRPQLPSFFVAGLTTNITPTLISDFRYSYLRNFWQWGSQNAPPQVAGLGGALEIAQGTSATAEGANALIPYNVNTQNIRQRFWDGHDNMLRDDLTWASGKHLYQFGGSFQRNWDYHMRTDNGVGINNQIVYQITSTNINFGNSPYIPSTVPASQASTYAALYSEVLGLVGQPQVVYTRSGNALSLQPVGSTATDRSTINYYQFYFGDTWRLKPDFTLVYSIGYALELPPVEQEGKQVMLVDSSSNPINVTDYLAARKDAALKGQVYNPALGFALVGNTAGGGRKYPYDPFYNQWSPRVSVAWNPHFKEGLGRKLMGDGSTVIRGGYSLIWGRINGVNQVLVPLLGVGLLQAVVCQGPSRSGQCMGAGGVDPSNVFRIGTDGMTAPLPQASQNLAQPFFPGVAGAAVAGDSTVLDPAYRPQRTDNFTFSIQRQITANSVLEAGVMSRLIHHETMQTNLDAVPHMTTLGGQTFAQAYSQLYQALAFNGATPGSVAAQPFFEAALGGASSASCKAYANCTAYVASAFTSQVKNAQVSDLWGSLNKAASWTLGRTMISGVPAQASSILMVNSLGYGNYNAAYLTWRARDFHNTTIISNFTYGRSLGTATLAQYNSSYTMQDPWNIDSNYGVNSFDYKFLYNLAMSYNTPWFRTQKGVVGRVLGGWTIAPLFFAQSGAPIGVGYTTGSGSAYQSFGQSSTTSITSNAEGAIASAPYSGGNAAHYNVAGSNGIGTNNPTGLNMFADPAGVYGGFRRCVLGYDTSCGGYGVLRGLATWNVDATLAKEIAIWKERVGATLTFQFTNALNHFQPANPSSLSLTSPTTFGRITGQSNTPRNLEFGLRVHF